MTGYDQIVIPSLQRDYVQGNRRDKISSFIDYLLDGLAKNEGIDLNYMYGTILKGSDETTSFVPIDGQQRMTTLWLLRLYLTARANVQQLGPHRPMVQRLEYRTREYAQDFCRALSEHVDAVVTPELKLVDIIRQPWFIDAWRHDVTVQGCMATLQIIDEKIGSRSTSELLEQFDEKIRFSLQTLDDDINDDIYIKMNGRGIHLTEFENMKAWLDQQVEREYASNPDDLDFIRRWQRCMDNEWADMVWQNRHVRKDDEEENPIDNLMLRLLYTLVYLYWVQHQDVLTQAIDEGGDDLKSELRHELGIESNDDLVPHVLSHLIRRDKFWLSEYLLEQLPIFSHESLRFIADRMDCLCLRWEQLNALDLYFWKESETTRFFQMFLDEALESIPYGKLALCHAVLAYPGSEAKEPFEEWMYRMRNLIVNQDVNRGNLLNIMGSVSKMGDYLKVAGFRQIFDDSETYPIEHFYQQQLTEEKLKSQVLDEELQRFMRKLENHPFFVGQIKFLFDFCGEKIDDKDLFKGYGRVMARLFNADGFSDYDHWRLRRALLAQSTSYGFGYYRSRNWNFLKSREDKRTFISDNTVNEGDEQPHNASLKAIVDSCWKTWGEGISSVSAKDLNELFDALAQPLSTVDDWRRYFAREEVWEYIQKEQNIRIENDRQIYLLQGVRMNGAYVDLRTYVLFLDWMARFSNRNISAWTFWRYEDEGSCIAVERKWCNKENGQEIETVIDVWHNINTENSFVLSIFVRDNREKTRELIGPVEGLPPMEYREENGRYWTAGSYIPEELTPWVEKSIELINRAFESRYSPVESTPYQ
ncbi:MAG TPA: DUF262 domain-containing protein [Candidatus Barnesiella merdigallinarum]|nr:DUF262 domain-containing protein [Candidatus Barnesiella merdigallinarum]